jgi:hypothetical protein
MSYVVALEPVGNVLRYLLWMTFTGLVAVGACLCGGYGVYIAWGRVGPPARRRRRSAEAAVTRESSRGITEIEAFLAAQCAPPGPEQ